MPGRVVLEGKVPCGKTVTVGYRFPLGPLFMGQSGEFGQQLFYVNLNMGGKSMGEKAACEKSAGELGVWG